MIETSPTLLARVKDRTDHSAWSRFDGLYRPLVARWVRASGVPRGDVEDLAQDILIAVVKAIGNGFEYDREKGKFRQYLSRSVRTKVIDYWRSRRRHPPHVALMGNEDPADDPNEKLWDDQYREHCLQQCLEQVRAEVDPVSWDIFLAYRVDKESAKKVASRLGMTEQAVASRAFRVIEKLRDAARGIDPDLWPGE